MNIELFEGQPIYEELKVATEELDVQRKREAEFIGVRERAVETIRMSEEQRNGIEGDVGKDESPQWADPTDQECERVDQRSCSPNSATPSKQLIDKASKTSKSDVYGRWCG